MKLMGFNFNKISIEKFSDNVEELKINTNIDISSINKVHTDLFKTKEEFLGIRFVQIINYEPKFAKIEFIGNILVAVESKIAKEVLKQWENKQIPETFRIPLFNLIMKKSAVKALELEEEINLPPHMPMPMLKHSED